LRKSRLKRKKSLHTGTNNCVNTRVYKNPTKIEKFTAQGVNGSYGTGVQPDRKGGWGGKRGVVTFKGQVENIRGITDRAMGLHGGHGTNERKERAGKKKK